jgi:Xaa-Pro aminopeptidase
VADSGRPIIANVERLNEFMDRGDIAAVVARSGQNFTYLSGIALPGTWGRFLDLADAPRGVMLLWPRKGESVIVQSQVNKGTQRMMARESWVKRIEVYQAYAESAYGRLCEVIKEAGLAEERVGFERNYLSAANWEEIQRRLPKLRMVDCTGLLDAVRSVKTAGEISLLKQAADLLDDVYLEVFSATRPGDTERDMHRHIVSGCIRRGVDSVHGAWAYGVLNTSSDEDDVAFRVGDIIRSDYIAYLRGYPGHQSRNAVIGQPSDEHRREYRIYRDIYRRTIDRCVPGARAGDIFNFVVEEFRKSGWEYKQVLVGHSVGPWWHQQEPILASGKDTVLEEGMVLAVEPITERWYLQDMIVVRKTSPEWLSDRFPTDEMFVIG